MTIGIVGVAYIFLFMFALYCLMLLLVALYYYKYLSKGWYRSEFIIYALPVMFIAVGMFLALIPLQGGIRKYLVEKIPLGLGTVAFYVLFYGPLMYYSLKNKVRFRCRKTVKVDEDGLEYVICYSDVVNAWYDGKRYYISDKLYEVLSPIERTAILYHEEGHAYNKFTNRVTWITTYAWYFVVATIIWAITLLMFENVDFLIFLTIALFMIPLIPMITLVTMTWSWINEHESDIRASKKVGKEAIISALIKTYIYAILHSYRMMNYIGGIKFKEIYLHNDKHKLSFLRVLITLAKYSWDAPLWFIDFFKKPMYTTHPPLEFRITGILKGNT